MFFSIMTQMTQRSTVRCATCDIKLRKLSEIMRDRHTCRCGCIYCHEHLHTHECENYTVDRVRQELAQQMPVVEPCKLNRI